MTSIKIADNGIANINLGPDAVTSDKIADGTISLGDMGSNSVNSSAIVNSTITTDDILHLTIDEEDIADSQITNVKLADNAVSIKILDGTITGADKWPPPFPVLSCTFTTMLATPSIGSASATSMRAR